MSTKVLDFFCVVSCCCSRHIFHETPFVYPLQQLDYSSPTYAVRRWKEFLAIKKISHLSMAVDVMPTHAFYSSGRIHAPSCQKLCDSMQNFGRRMARVAYSIFNPRRVHVFLDVIVDDFEKSIAISSFFSSLAQMAHLCLEIRNCEITARVELLLFLHFSFYIIVIMAHGNINYNNNNNSTDDPAVLLSTL